MQYALLDVGHRKLLIDANEFGLLKSWKDKQVEELSGFCESDHPYYLCYGGYLLNPEVSDKDIDGKLKSMENFWLAAIDDTALNCHQIAFYSIYTLPVISVGYQKVVPFAALIKSDDCIIHKIATKSDFAVSAFLRVQEWDVATNILNREGIFAFKGVEMRFKEPVSEDNWKRLISEDRAIRCANKLIRCKG
ncbi:TPA: DNA topoisomerase III [Citrobacter freundii]|nr:DNA topoisomerase III [Citrobacter freundii]HCD1461012.1 DNA topoisomerase III [Citrobacter freundii]HCD2018514.1 DNA topoisomerase III [Citrobacter freundii]HCD3571241.1 DNA topoisomerase III [Citrobacter freundii]HCD4629398.1 DNA topoisomerase III [Citrobacter freundii]